MSLETWKAEFYPISAAEAAQDGRLAAIKHSLQKWSGLTERQLRAHDIAKAGRSTLVSAGPYRSFDINSSTCALCSLYLKSRSFERCKGCPLVALLGAPCDTGPCNPYNAFTVDDKPGPMIDALNALLR